MPHDETAERLESVPGVGRWTAAAVERRSRSWEPWRAYAAVQLWNHLSTGESRDEDTPR